MHYRYNDIMISSVGYILSCYPTKPLPIWERFITIINSPHSQSRKKELLSQCRGQWNRKIYCFIVNANMLDWFSQHIVIADTQFFADSISEVSHTLFCIPPPPYSASMGKPQLNRFADKTDKILQARRFSLLALCVRCFGLVE
jgi:hypothetical protein